MSTFKTLFMGVGFAAIATLSACSSSSNASLTQSGLNPADFDSTVLGKKTELVTLKNANGMEVCLTNYGGRVVSISVPDKDGKPTDVVLGYDNIHQYADTLNSPSDYGSSVGRYANRIKDAKLSLAGSTYQLKANDNGNCLHGGGATGWLNQVYDITEKNDSSVTFTINAKDGENGFPGEFDVSVKYEFTEDNELRIHYQGICDEPTVANMTNHSYFNLNGEGSGTAMDQYLTIHAKYYTPVADSHSIPTGVYEEVAGTPMDFSTAKQIGQDIEAEFEQLKFTGGYDHNYVTDNYAKGNRRLIATAYSDKTGIAMDVTSDCPCVQFYAANFVENEHGKNGHTYNKRDAFCLETQVEPNAVNVEDFHSPILNAGEQYDSVTAYHFYIRK